MGVVWIAALLLVGFAALWLLGRSAMARSVTELEKSKATIVDFHNDITLFANGGLKDGQLFDRLAIDCPKVEEALGWDNIVHGVKVGHYLLNGAAILPRALFQVRDAMRSTFDTQTSYQIIAAVRGVLLHSGGRHDLAIERIVHDSRNPVTVIMRGWSLVVAVPLYVLRGAGLLSSRQTSRASSSLLFRLVSIVLFVAALAGPVLAYLADRAAIEKEVTRLTGSR